MHEMPTQVPCIPYRHHLSFCIDNYYSGFSHVSVFNQEILNPSKYMIKPFAFTNLTSDSHRKK